jgi:23S rRNA G2445 N2-methylase RlmL
MSEIEMKPDTGDFEMVATTLFGLEEVLAKELQTLGARDVRFLKRARP